MLDQSPPPRTQTGIPVFIWILIGVGGLGLIGFFLAIIAAIALPSFLTQATKARQAEAESSLGAIIRGEQAHFLEHNRFAPSVSALNLSLPASTSYQYALQPQGKTAIRITATPLKAGLKSYTGAVFAIAQGNEALMTTQICESVEPSQVAPAMPTAPRTLEAAIACPPGSQPLP